MNGSNDSLERLFRSAARGWNRRAATLDDAPSIGFENRVLAGWRVPGGSMIADPDWPILQLWCRRALAGACALALGSVLFGLMSSRSTPLVDRDAVMIVNATLHSSLYP